MSRFFFHIEDGASMQDNEGTELRGRQEALVEAVRLAGGMMRDEPELFLNENWSIRVTDHDGLDVFRYNLFPEVAPATTAAHLRNN